MVRVKGKIGAQRAHEILATSYSIAFKDCLSCKKTEIFSSFISESFQHKKVQEWLHPLQLQQPPDQEHGTTMNQSVENISVFCVVGTKDHFKIGSKFISNQNREDKLFSANLGGHEQSYWSYISLA